MTPLTLVARRLAFLVVLTIVAVATPQGAPQQGNRWSASAGTAPALPGAPHVEQRASFPAVTTVSGDAGSNPAGGAPQPTPALTTAPSAEPYQRGWATWCAPTPTQCQSWGGDARLGAMPSFRWGDAPFAARVCTDGTACTTVTVVSFCACGDRHGIPTVIDLSPAAMEAIEPDYRRLGIVRVTVEFPAGPRLTLPPTDTGGEL